MYQRQLARQGPQQRLEASELPDSEAPLGLLTPVEPVDEPVVGLDIQIDPNTGERFVRLTLEEAIARTLANSPEIRVVSFDPEIARYAITQATADFDPTAFSRFNYEDQDSPQNSIFEPGQAETRMFESGVRQRSALGSEWSASYALARVWDDLFGRTFPTRYEPVLIFELRQPLLRDAWEQVNLAGVNVARLNYEAALLGFREKAEEVSASVIAAYWRLAQAQRDLAIQHALLDQTLESLHKVEGRRDIDATDVQIKQAEAYVKSREAMLLEMRKRVTDVQDLLTRLMADPQINLTSDVSIVPAAEPQAPEELPELAVVSQSALALAMQRNPSIERARFGVEVAQINLAVAKNQKMPRLDLVGSVRSRGLAENSRDAHDQLEGWDYTTYGVGLTLEYPLGNRQRHAEWMRRQMEKRKAISVLHSTADEVAAEVKERMRQVRTSYEEIQVQRAAVEAARIHLETLEESEEVRDRLTPEFLLVKLQAQETYAQAQRAEVAAVVGLKIASAQLAQVTGTVLDLREVDLSLSSIVDTSVEMDRPPTEVKPPNIPEILRQSPSF